VLASGILIVGHWQGATTLGVATLMSYVIAVQIHKLVHHYG